MRRYKKQLLNDSKDSNEIPKTINPTWDILEYPSSRLIRFWYKAVIEGKKIESKEKKSNKQ